ncbi:MAG: hypothetical protein LBR37_01870 [Erysipelotrichaceae bacterium]|jgi:hypothetical protein|nr:hypothetical protein [Erysipelotrichaceae bacterium]
MNFSLLLVATNLMISNVTVLDETNNQKLFLNEVKLLETSSKIRILEAAELTYDQISLKQAAIIEKAFNEAMNKYASGLNKSVTSIYALEDFSDNDYLLGVYNDNEGYAILHLTSGDFVEIAPFTVPPLNDLGLFSINSKEIIPTGLKYFPMNGIYEHDKNTASYINLHDNSIIKETEIENVVFESELYSKAIVDTNYNYSFNAELRGEVPIQANAAPRDGTPGDGLYPAINGLLTADKEVPRSWYFKRSTHQFAYDNPAYKENPDGGSCGYVAIGLILSYAEIFSSTGYFSASESAKFISPYYGYENYSQAVPIIRDNLIPYLYDLHKRPYGTTPIDARWIVDEFLIGKNKAYEDYMWLAFSATPSDPIKDGVPAIFFGNFDDPSDPPERTNHAIVAYGYYNTASGTPSDKFLTHFGWKKNSQFSQVIMTIPNIFRFGGVYALYNKAPHVHNKYFEIAYTNSLGYGIKYYCGCGQLMEDEFHLDGSLLTVTWKNYDGTILEVDQCARYSLPVYNGPTPTRTTLLGLNYVFDGWSPSVHRVTRNMTYTATFTFKIPTITWPFL